MEITKNNIISVAVVLLVFVAVFFAGYFTGSRTGQNATSIAAVKVENNINQSAAGINDAQSGITTANGTIKTVQSSISSSQQSVETVSNGLNELADESEIRTGQIDECINLARQLDSGISDLQKNYGKNDSETKNSN